ncbi:MAG: hypothetical protein DRQ62_13710 [Gammaproteobacteria bacterium]|nr:MAG: hypothetical protein DRQ62_13710 [Gammaproteobacteria bacterium]
MANIVLNDLPVDFIDEWRTHCLAEDTPELISESVDQLGAMSLADWEMHGIKMALNECEGNISLASKKLGITRTTLYKKIERFGLRKTKESVVYA